MCIGFFLLDWTDDSLLISFGGFDNILYGLYLLAECLLLFS